MQATSNDYYIPSKLLPLGDVLCWPPDSIFQSVNAITVQKRGKLEKFIQPDEKDKNIDKINEAVGADQIGAFSLRFVWFFLKWDNFNNPFL